MADTSGPINLKLHLPAAQKAEDLDEGTVKQAIIQLAEDPEFVKTLQIALLNPGTITISLTKHSGPPGQDPGPDPGTGSGI